MINQDGATNLKVLPKEIGGLLNLRYLGFRDTSIESLTKTIKNLSRLQFLDVRNDELECETNSPASVGDRNSPASAFSYECKAS